MRPRHLVGPACRLLVHDVNPAGLYPECSRDERPTDAGGRQRLPAYPPAGPSRLDAPGLGTNIGGTECCPPDHPGGVEQPYATRRELRGVAQVPAAWSTPSLVTVARPVRTWATSGSAAVEGMW